MCTVTYLPFSNGHFVLSSNRDESPERDALIWDHKVVAPGGEELHYPKDPKADGTWICSSNFGRAACLLNGAEKPYDIGKEFTKSRGQIVLDSFSAPTFADFCKASDFESCGPFTLILRDEKQLLQIQWDGKRRWMTDLGIHEPKIWSAVTLYSPAVREWRESIFNDWLSHIEVINQEKILQFHRFGTGEDKTNGFVMNRNNVVRTLSITSFAFDSSNIVIKHLNLAGEYLNSKRVPIISSKSLG